MERPVIRTAAWLLTFAALALLLAWVVSRVVSDRFEWSQYLFWVPTPAVLLVGCLLLLTASALGRAARPISPRDRLGPRAPAARTRAVAWAGWLGVLAWMFFAEWNGARYLTGPPPPPQSPAEGTLRVLFWNSMDAPELVEDALSRHPDVVVLTNPPTRVDWAALRGGLGEASTTRRERHAVASRFPILRWGATSLGIKGARPRSFIFRGGGYVIQDTGHAMFLELDTGLLNRPLVLWVIDLPSDFNLSRWEVMRQAAATLHATPGPAYRRVEGRDVPEEIEGFPTPDLIVGDFNTPRGSESLKELTGSMADAFEQAGRGFAATWPREWPALAIDHAFVGPELRATGYEVVDFGEGRHRAEVVDVVAR